MSSYAACETAAVLGVVVGPLERVDSGPMWIRPRSAPRRRRRREARQAGEREIHLGRHARRAEVAGPLDVVGVERHRVEQPQQRCCGSTAEATARPRSLRRRRARRRRRGRPSAAAARRRRPCGSQRRSRARARERPRQRAEAALHEHGRAGAAAVAGRGLEQEVGRRSRRPRAGGHSLACHAPRSRRPAAVLEPLLSVVRDRHRAPAQQAWPSSRPSRRSAQPKPASGNRSRRSGRSTSGGVSSSRRPSRPSRASVAWNAGQRAASLAGQRAISAALRVGSPNRLRPRPSGCGAKTRGSGSVHSRPWR